MIILLVSIALGVHIHTGVLGWLVIIVVAILVNSAFAGISQAIALLTRRESTMIAVANFIGLPLLFLSTTMLAQAQMPHWMQIAARFNPVNWGVHAARAVVLPGTSGARSASTCCSCSRSPRHRRLATWTFRRTSARCRASAHDRADRLADRHRLRRRDRELGDGAGAMRVTSFSIFIASTMQSTCPASTTSPSATFTSRTVPCIGLTTGRCRPPPAPAATRSRRRRASSR